MIINAVIMNNIINALGILLIFLGSITEIGNFFLLHNVRKDKSIKTSPVVIVPPFLMSLSIFILIRGYNFSIKISLVLFIFLFHILLILIIAKLKR